MTTMTTMSSSRVLKAADGATEHVMLLERTPVDLTPVAPTDVAHDLGDQPVSFSAEEVDRLCEEARLAGAADAAEVLEPALHRIADGLETLNERGVEALALALHADSERVAKTALDVARWILGRELNDELEVLSLATRALSENGGHQATRIRVSPDLADALAAIAPADVDVAPDGSLEPGEFTAETEGPDVSFRYTAAFDRALDALTTEVGS